MEYNNFGIFDITLPETLNLPQNAAVWVSDVVISNTMPTLGTGSGTIRHNFYRGLWPKYFFERLNLFEFFGANNTFLKLFGQLNEILITNY